MKRILYTLICTILIFTFAGCNNSNIIEEIIPVKNDVRITFPEGFTVYQIAQRLEENEVCTKDEFLERINSPENLDYTFLSNIENAENRPYLLEGYIFPDTYDFIKNEGADKAVRRFLNNFNKKLGEDAYQKAENLGFNIDEIITLASIIQKEADVSSEMNKVSSVLHNRLNASYNRLECDVTINYLNKYVIPNLETDSDRYNEFYNTYKCYGLPAGAICNPGIEAIKAALEPADTNYMFFVTDQSGNYLYAETYEEHLENCKRAGLG